MSKQTKGPIIQCRFFAFRLFSRKGVYYADGRVGGQKLGKHSLGTRDETQAKQALFELDQAIAVGKGLLPRGVQLLATDLSVEDGWRLYLDSRSGSAVAGGVSPRTLKRYRAVQDKFILFAKDSAVATWKLVTESTLVQYSKSLFERSYAERSIYLELTTLKQLVKWLFFQKYVDRCLTLPLKRPRGTNTHCWSQEQVRAILEHCADQRGLSWLHPLLLCLACTGMRIGELAALRWCDIDLSKEHILLKDESADRHVLSREARTLKSGKGREIPIFPDLLAALKKIQRTQDGFVFHGPKGGRIKPDVVRNAFKRDVIRPLSNRFKSSDGDVGFQHGRLHSFRHYFCSACALQGVPQRLLMEWLGHEDSVMCRHYFHSDPKDSLRQLAKVQFVPRQDRLPSETGESDSSEVATT